MIYNHQLCLIEPPRLAFHSQVDQRLEKRIPPRMPRLRRSRQLRRLLLLSQVPDERSHQRRPGFQPPDERSLARRIEHRWTPTRTPCRPRELRARTHLVRPWRMAGTCAKERWPVRLDRLGRCFLHRRIDQGGDNVGVDRDLDEWRVLPVRQREAQSVRVEGHSHHLRVRHIERLLEPR